MPDWMRYLDEREGRSLEELRTLLSIPSVSALPEHAGDVRRAAEWAADRLRAAGLEHVRIVPTSGHPLVYADWLHAPGKATVLVYGHVDVQPVDPLELWDSPPFDPQVRDGRVYARGASDMKGNFLGSILGLEAVLQTRGELPVNIKVMVEAEEEIGSPSVPAVIAGDPDLFACDFVASADGLQWSEDQPQLLVGLRGAVFVQIDVQGPRGDLHSGVYGGAVANPIHALAQILASMHDPDGTIRVAGFHDRVRSLTGTEREEIRRIPFDERAYVAEIGVPEVFGEPGYTTFERVWVRPTLEVNGIWGGFQGEGVKTVLPAEAHAKISCRLVPDQDPDEIVEIITAHVRAEAPPGVRVDVRPIPGSGRPYLMPADFPANRTALAALERVYGKQPYVTRAGSTLPLAGIFLEGLGAYTVTLGFTLPDEQFHAPNEFYRLRSFRKAKEVWATFIDGLPAPDA